jgi:hypothetical protein
MKIVLVEHSDTSIHRQRPCNQRPHLLHCNQVLAMRHRGQGRPWKLRRIIIHTFNGSKSVPQKTVGCETIHKYTNIHVFTV